MQYKKNHLEIKKPSELIEVKHEYGGNGSEYLSLVLLIASAIMIVNFILNIIEDEQCINRLLDS